MDNQKNRPNRLAQEKSPYLLQHAYNPVDWWPWCEEAFAKAKAEDKPIFLSIGYSTCHWCHVMERESFEDGAVAAVLQKGYIAIKVDREERPDIDHIYMTVCQALTGQGGWPLTVVMTPEKKPFFAGTYFPKESRRGMPGLIDILGQIKEVWQNERSRLLQSGEEITEMLNTRAFLGTPGELPSDVTEQAYNRFLAGFDRTYGGFGRAPKFPSPHNLTFLLRYYYVRQDKAALEMVEKTLVQMYKGGIFDHIGFGFSRYSTDTRWLVPHFEKMLYDNALLAIAYLEAHQITKKEVYRETAAKVFAYVLRDMTSPLGGFYSAEDADSEGEEGKFYVWSPAEIVEILGAKEGDFYCRLYDITTDGNFEGRNIPNLIERNLRESSEEEESRAEKCRQALFEAREKRVHPHKDDKILTAWNALMIAALAIGARILQNHDYQEAAIKALRFIFKYLMDDEGRLFARYRDGEAAYPAYLDDYAFLVWALLEMYATTYEPEYLKRAVSLNASMLELFWDEEHGGLYLTGQQNEELPARPKNIYDGALPSGNSVAAENLLRLAALTGESVYEEKAAVIFRTFGGDVSAHPTGYTRLLQAYLYWQAAAREIVIVSKKEQGEAKEMLDIIKGQFMPHTVSLYVAPGRDSIVESAPYLSAYQVMEEPAAAYICENHSCRAPLYDADSLRQALG